MKRKLLSILLCLVMALSLLPTAALAEGEKVARVGDTAEYTTLADAIEAAQGGETVTLLADITGQTEIPAGKNIVLDLNGKTMTHTGTTLYNSGTLTVRDSSAEKSGKIVSTGNVGIGVNHNSITTIEYANIEAVEGAVITGYATGAEITIQDGIFAASDNAVIAGNGNSTDHSGTERKNANTITINGGKFTGNIKTPGYIACGIYAPWKDIVTVNGGEFTVNNGIGIVARAGQVKVNGGTFTCSGSAAGKVGDKNFNMTAAQCLYFDATDPAYPAYNSTTDYIKVTGGTFSSAVPVNCCAPGFEPTKNDDGTYGVKIKANLAAEVLDAQGNTVGAYDTLTAAITAAQNGDTVVLLKNVTENVTISADKTITLDLNGKKLTNADEQDTITVALGASLTVTGTGTVDNVTHGKAAVYNKGTVTLADGTYERSAEAGKDANDAGGNSFYTVLNHGNMTVEADVVVNNKGKYSSLFENGYYNYSNRDGVVNPTLTIKGGTFDGGLNTIKNDDNATLTIKDGTFQNYTQAAFQNHNIATVEGGTFIGGGSAKAVLQCGVCSTADEEHDKHQLTISSGYFFGEITKTVGTISITGGTFSSDPSVYVVGNGSANIVKRDGSEGAYTYTVLAKSGLTSGVYLTNPSGALASNYYVSSTANGVWTVSYSAPYSGGSSSYVPTYSVSTPSKTENGSVTVSPKNASKGDTVTVTVKPDSGYVLETLTVTDKNGNELTLKDKGNGKYTFTMPTGKVEVKATFMEDNSMLNFFYDVPNNAYFYEAVKWAVKNGITTGVGNYLFAPEQPCTRAQIVTFLWRAAGSPEPKSAASGMTDVVSGSYYEKAVAWAIENGITTGTTTSTFSPDATCTRAQAVTFLARALNAKATSVAEFSDVPTNSYFADAVAWAAANGVTEGIGGGLFGSDNDCTRGQIVTFLYRAYNK